MTKLVSIFIPLAAFTLAASAPANESSGEQIATTRHQIKVGQKILRYTARAGLLPIRRNETGEIHGHMFFAAYLLDLVFVDPIGTGFSRPIKAEYGAEFYNTLGDIASVAEFIRVYLTRFDAWDSPLFIGGESYGVWRAAGVAEALAQRGRKVAGVILISGGIPFGPVVSDEMQAALFIPTRTAAAFFHKKLPPDLQADLASALEKAETWARTECAPALSKRDKLSESERQTILTQLARFTGLDASLIGRQTLIVARQQFAEQLLRDRKQALGRFDTRQIASSESRPRAERNLVINKYLRSMLKFKTDLAYQGIEEGFSPNTRGRVLSVGVRWNYNQGPPP